MEHLMPDKALKYEVAGVKMRLITKNQNIELILEWSLVSWRVYGHGQCGCPVFP